MTPTFRGIPVDKSKYKHYNTTNYEVEKVIEFKEKSKQVVSVNLRKNDPIHLIFENGTEWTTSGNDFKELYENQKVKIFTSEVFTKEGHESNVKLKALIKLKFKGNSKDDIGEKFESVLVKKPGLYFADNNLTLKKFKPKNSETNKRYLLFIHGEMSNTDISFSELFRREDGDGTFLDKLKDVYDENILIFEHRTINVNPIQNSLDLLKALPSDTELDIVGFSRGGYIADIIAWCDKKTSFNQIEFEKNKHISEKDRKLINDLLTLRIEKSICVNRVIHVACPMNGANVLFNGRLDHFINIHIAGQIDGSSNLAIKNELKEFLYDTIRTKTKLKEYPGLESMRPESAFISLLNSTPALLYDQLISVQGQPKVLLERPKTISKILQKLNYFEANDFLINIGSTQGGMKRHASRSFYDVPDEDVNHFNYFSKQSVRSIIVKTLTTPIGSSIYGLDNVEKSDAVRGLRQILTEIKDTYGEKVSGERPIVLLLPGIMGSNLSVDGQKIWLNASRLIAGGISTYLDLKSTTHTVDADSIIGQDYKRIVDYFADDYDVDVFAYDWRKDITTLGKRLEKRIEKLLEFKQPLKILAHSMGGLVVKSVMINAKPTWEKFVKAEKSCFVMLGTPWNGSYELLSVLTGQNRKIRQLALWSINTKQELMRVVGRYPSLYQMLPVEERKNFEDHKFWKNLEERLEISFPIPETKLLNKLKEYNRSLLSADEYDFSNTFYIAGKAERTYDGYKVESHLFGNNISYTTTKEGDGRVTWKLGIPEKLAKENIYYTQVKHGNLADSPPTFQGIRDLFERGITPMLSNDKPAGTRGGTSYDDEFYVSYDEKEGTAILLGRAHKYHEDYDPFETLNVTVVHGDLKMASFPLLTGHFQSEGITNAEKALDNQLEQKLTRRYDIRRYPEKLNDNIVLIDFQKAPKGAVIVGLGEALELTSFELSETVKSAVLEYMLFMESNYKNVKDQRMRCSISSLFIGSSISNISLENSISSILIGVAKANKVVEQLDVHIPKIKNIEFIENMDFIVANGYSKLYHLAKDTTKVKIDIKNGIVQKHGRKKGLYYKEDTESWCTITTYRKSTPEVENLVDLSFNLSIGNARIDKNSSDIPKALIDDLLDKMQNGLIYNKRYAKTLFELLIPNSIKYIIRSQNNIIWKLDKYTSTIPWEMFHDMEVNSEPTFTNAGLIRKVKSKKYRNKPEIVRNPTALVIGISKYIDKKLDNLKEVYKEAKKVGTLLTNGGFRVEEVLDRDSIQVINKLMNQRYKVLHINGHGIYDPIKKKVGIILKDGTLLRPKFLKKKSVVPEFAFINTCSSGIIEEKASQVKKHDQNIIASNIGTQLVEMGTEAVVVTGWEILEDAAHVFAEKLYTYLLEGYYFGMAVLKARNACYKYKPDYNTWAAYQCYGNPWYKLVNKPKGRSNGKEYVLEKEVHIDLENLILASSDKKSIDTTWIEDQLKKIISKIKGTTFYSSKVIELVAEVYKGIGHFQQALDTYEQLLQRESADYSFKSFEQYCNMLAKLLLAKHRSGGEKVTDNEKAKLMSNLAILKSLFPTAERISIQASAYKRLAIIEQDDSQRKKYLRLMTEMYKEAYSKARTGNINASVYPLANWYAGEALLNEYTSEQKLEWVKHLKETKENLEEGRDFWEEVAPVNIALCLMLFTEKKDPGALEEYKKDIIETYKKKWDIAGNKKNLLSEIEHFNFLILFSERDEIKKKLKEIIEDIERQCK